MRFIKKLILPVLTVAVILAAILLPRELSRLKDNHLIGRVFTEAFDGNSLSLDYYSNLSDKLALLLRNKLSDNVSRMVSEIENAEQIFAQAEKELIALAEKVSVIEYEPDGSVLSWYGQQELYMDPDSGLYFRVYRLTLERAANPWVVEALIEAESGSIVELNLMYDYYAYGTLVLPTARLDRDTLWEINMTFAEEYFDYLGLEGEVWLYLPEGVTYYRLTENDVIYQFVFDEMNVEVTLFGFAEDDGTAGFVE